MLQWLTQFIAAELVRVIQNNVGAVALIRRQKCNAGPGDGGVWASEVSCGRGSWWVVVPRSSGSFEVVVVCVKTNGGVTEFPTLWLSLPFSGGR